MSSSKPDPISLNVNSTNALHARVRGVLLDRKLTAIEREDEILKLATAALRKLGDFCRTEGGEVFFFHKGDHRLYEFPQGTRDSPFHRLVTYHAGLSAEAALTRHVLNRLRTALTLNARVVTVHTFAYSSPDHEFIAVNNFGGGMWVRQRHGEWQLQANGSEDILFWTPESQIVEPWTPEFSQSPEIRDRDSFLWLVEQFHFADHELTVKDQRLLMAALIVSMFYPAINLTWPIHAHLGSRQREQRTFDTGKTTAAKMVGLWISGPTFDVQRTPDADSSKARGDLQLSLMHEPYTVLDNVDTEVKWLNDFLCTYATGGRSSERRLYTNTERVEIPRRGRLALTSRKAKFNREDVASRTLPFRFAEITGQERKTEHALLGPVKERRGRIWAGVLDLLAQIQDELDVEPPSPQIRLADFEQFGWRVARALGDADAWEQMIPRLNLAQSTFALGDDPLVTALRRVLMDGDLPEQRTSDLYKRISESAGQGLDRLVIPSSASACTEQIKSQKGQIETVLGVRISFRVLDGNTLVSIEHVGSGRATERAARRSGRSDRLLPLLDGGGRYEGYEN